MADTYALKNVMSVTKDSSKEEGTCTDFTIGEGILYQDVQSLDNEAPDNTVMNTGAKNSNQTIITCATKTASTTNPIAENYTSTKSCKRFICILVTITLVTTYTIALICLAVLFYKIAQPQQTSSIVLLQLEQINKSLTSIQNQITILSREEMENNATQSNDIQQLNTSIDMQLSTLHNQTLLLSVSSTLLQQQHYELHKDLLGLFPSFPAASCSALPPSSPSGYYWVSTSNGSSALVYCTMSCGTLTGGWMRVGFLDMTNSSHQCPSGFMERNDSPNIRTCVRNEASGGCTSVELSTVNIQYSTVCGRITGYHIGTVNGFEGSNINSAYVDGVSLTHGTPRQHIWSFAAGYSTYRTSLDPAPFSTVCACVTLIS